MDVEIKILVDEIMEKMHQISWWFMELEKKEILGVEISKDKVENNKAINMIFKDTQKLYRQLQELVKKQATKEVNGYYYGYEENSITEDEEPIYVQDVDVATATILAGIDQYLETSYIELKYITALNEDNEIVSASIYKGTPFEKIIFMEYSIQKTNLNYMQTRLIINEDKGHISPNTKANILNYIALNKFYDNYAIDTINKYIEDMKNEEDESGIEKFYEEKYEFYYIYLNNKYNGIFQENDVEHFATIKKYIDDENENLILGMSEFEIERNIEAHIMEYINEFDNYMKNISEEIKNKEPDKQLSKKEKNKKKEKNQKTELINEIDEER